MSPVKKQICVAGLGQFGTALALSLARHAEVLALDRCSERVNAISDHVHRALVADLKDADALGAIVSDDFDEAVVSTGRDLESAILCTLHLKRIGVRVIRAKAVTDDHAEILRLVGATQVIFPERETAKRIAARIVNPNLLDFVPLAEGYRVIESHAPDELHGKSLEELNLRQRYGIFVLAVKKTARSSFVFLPGPDYEVAPGDDLVVIGNESHVTALWNGGARNSRPRFLGRKKKQA